MKTEQIEQLRVEMQALATKHGVTKWAFCGEDKKRVFLAFLEHKQTQGGAMLTIINVGRLWQYARQTCREVLNFYERLP